VGGGLDGVRGGGVGVEDAAEGIVLAARGRDIPAIQGYTLLFAVLVNVVGSEQRISEKNRADDLLTQVRERVQRLSKLAADHASVVLKDLESSGVLADQGVSEENVRRRLTTLAQSFPDRDAKIAIVVEITSDGNVSRIHSSPQGGADPRFDAPNVGVAVSWGTLVFSGVSNSARLKVQVAGAVDAAALRPVRMRREDGESIALLAPVTRRGAEEIEGGEALSGTLVGERLPGDEARSAIRLHHPGIVSVFDVGREGG
jgi:hypothetical protein